jgi:hypothetical protein
VRDTKAVGRRWTNAVAIRTPVPKCCDMNMNLPAAVFFDARLEIRGNPQALKISSRIPAQEWTAYQLC